jgi:hypothetical protein
MIAKKKDNQIEDLRLDMNDRPATMQFAQCRIKDAVIEDIPHRRLPASL